MLARHVTRNHNMTHSDYEVLVRLDGAGGAMRMTTLAEQVVSSAQKLTHPANRLEQRGWIERRPVAEDGRGLLATLTDDGRRALAGAAGEHAELVKRFLLDLLSAEEQRLIGGAMEEVSAHLRIHRRGEPCPRCDGEAG